MFSHPAQHMYEPYRGTDRQFEGEKRLVLQDDRFDRMDDCDSNINIDINKNETPIMVTIFHFVCSYFVFYIYSMLLLQLYHMKYVVDCCLPHDMVLVIFKIENVIFNFQFMILSSVLFWSIR